jgi:hypothetical protein
MINIRANPAERANFILCDWNHILLGGFVVLWFKRGKMMLHRKQGMSAHKIVQGLGEHLCRQDNF